MSIRWARHSIPCFIRHTRRWNASHRCWPFRGRSQVCVPLTVDEGLEKSYDRLKCLNGECFCWQPRNRKKNHFNSAFLFQPVPSGDTLIMREEEKRERERNYVNVFLFLFCCLCRLAKASPERVCRDEVKKKKSAAKHDIHIQTNTGHSVRHRPKKIHWQLSRLWRFSVIRN